ncbi:B12-binding domain-containing radical SAM protein [Desulfoluna spongiiphila]|uniref:B12-binding domain-containing radical SAM protein n=1 Tax=Desulfoluna spongiiphila TaxID=419481 RepID=UPI0012592AF2|nr:B12-binding domain-containing radical SAM protein [Desulfoluna spongiiphila]VVS95270.1 elp3/miab/nifb [Desulfoluna spongiiphila]
MPHTLLLQLPVPRHQVGAKSGNIPLGPACLKLAAETHTDASVEIFPETLATHGGDAAILEEICKKRPDILGLTLTCWNVERSLHLAEEVKKRCGARIVAGGPEVTVDNPLTRHPAIDFRVYGEGEEVFVKLLKEPGLWDQGEASGCAPEFFMHGKNPYIENILDPGPEEIMLLETQRGCPYGCKFCYYNKARKGLTFLSDEKVLEGIRWAVCSGVKELYLLDPSLNARPGLKDLLKEIAKINPHGALALRSEIRAEWIDAEAAELFAAAGFTVFEIGLQSTCRKAQKLMGRNTDLTRFVEGVSHLKGHGILSTVDLIIGLPGDDLTSFSSSLRFVKENGLDDDVQVFPLALLPGTAFRQESESLGLRFQEKPPYTIIETPGFSPDEITLAMDWTESLLDMDLMTPPEVNLSWKTEGLPAHRSVTPEDRELMATFVVTNETTQDDARHAAARLSYPYQVVITPEATDDESVFRILAECVSRNPHTPCEIIWVEPDSLPDAVRIVAELPLFRPHFLDNELALLDHRPGNRAILCTLVSTDPHPLPVPMGRSLKRFSGDALPTRDALEDLNDADGAVIDAPDTEALQAWQESMAPHADEMFPIAFSDHGAMAYWRELTRDGDWVF